MTPRQRRAPAVELLEVVNLTTQDDPARRDVLARLAHALDEVRRRRALDLPGTVRTYPHVVQRTDPWYALRCGILTASAVGRLLTARTLTAIEYPCPACDAPADEPCRSKAARAATPIKTVHPERTARAVAGRATSPTIVEPATGDDARAVVTIAAAERLTGFVDPTFVSLDMQRGVDDEPLAVDAYAEHTGSVVEPCGFIVRTWGDGVRLGYSPDGLVDDDGLVEVKSRRGRTQVEHVLAGVVPAENMAQLQAGLFVTGRAWIDYVSYSGGLHLWTRRVTPDPVWFAAIRSAVEVFEVDVAATVDAYRAAVVGLPLTERAALDMVI